MPGRFIMPWDLRQVQTAGRIRATATFLPYPHVDFMVPSAVVGLVAMHSSWVYLHAPSGAVPKQLFRSGRRRAFSSACRSTTSIRRLNTVEQAKYTDLFSKGSRMGQTRYTPLPPDLRLMKLCFKTPSGVSGQGSPQDVDVCD